MSNKKNRLSNSIFLGHDQHINNTFIKNYKKNIIINVEKNSNIGFSEKIINEYCDLLKLDCINPNIVMSSLELNFDDLKKDYNNNICKIGTETKDGHFLKNGNIKLNQQIDYMYLYKGMSYQPALRLKQVCQDKIKIILDKPVPKDIKLSLQLNLFILSI
jgi:hypothetical protein